MNQPNYYGAPPENVFLRKRLEKRELRLQSFYASLAVLLFIFVQQLLLFALEFFGLYEKYLSDPLFNSGMETLIIFLSLFVPFSACGKLLKKESGVKDALPFEKPVRRSLMPLAVLAGLGCCMLANEITGFIVFFMRKNDVVLSSPELSMPEGTFGVVVSFCRIIVFAALVEEIAFRGHIMQNLRKFGDGFAIFMAALLFALIHGNLVQAPFALIVGCALGYLSLKTGTLWTAVIIHALNNLISFAESRLVSVVREDILSIATTIFMYVLTIIGLLCFIVFINKAADFPLRESKTLLSTAEKTVVYLTTPTMLAAIALMLYLTAQYIS